MWIFDKGKVADKQQYISSIATNDRRLRENESIVDSMIPFLQPFAKEKKEQQEKKEILWIPD